MDGRKAALVERLTAHHRQAAPASAPASVPNVDGPAAVAGAIRSARAAAADKAAAKESRAVEHIAEDEDLLEEGESEWLELPGGIQVPGGTRQPKEGDDEPLDDLDDDVQAAILQSVQASAGSLTGSSSSSAHSSSASGSVLSPTQTAGRKRAAGAGAEARSTPGAREKRAGETCMIATGSSCIVVGLQSRADLNGKPAIVHSRDVKRDRWNVYVDGEAKKLSLREDNLTLQIDAGGDEDEVDAAARAGTGSKRKRGACA